MTASASRNTFAEPPLLSRLKEIDMLTGGLLWLIGIPIPVILLVWFFFLRGR